MTIQDFVKNNVKIFIRWIFLTIILAIVMVANAYLLKYITESLTRNNWEVYNIVAVCVLLYVILQGCIHYIRQKNSEIFSIKVMNFIRSRLFLRLLGSTLYSLRSASTEKYISQFTTQLTIVKQSYLDSFTWGVYLFFQFIFATILAFYINPLLASVSLILCAPLILIPIMSRKIISSNARKVVSANDNLNQYIVDSVQTSTDWKMSQSETYINKRYLEKTRAWELSSIKAATV